MISSEDTFFFDQAPFRQPIKRYKKSADELPQSLRFAQQNPKLAGFYKDSKQGDDANLAEISENEDTKERLLPEVTSNFSNIRNQLLSGFLPGFDSNRQLLQESKTGAPGLLEELAKLLPLVKISKKKLTYPHSLENQLQSTYDDLIYDAQYVKRDWQVLDNQLKHDAELQEKKAKESSNNNDNNDNKKNKNDMSDSEDDVPKIEIQGTDGQRVKTQHRRKRRQIQSQPAIIEESTPRHSKIATPSRKSRHGSAPRKSVTAPGFKSDLGRTIGEDGMSEASHSIRSGHPVATQTYSMQVLAFNLSNYHAWENKGCHVFGINKEGENDHPLEWVVKRLNRSSASIKIDQEQAILKHYTELPYTRYYMENFNEKALAKAAADKLGIFHTVVKGGKPKIPSLKPKASKGQVLCAQVTDGSKTIYYESGEIAIVTSFHGDKGYFVLMYDRDEPKRLLASFTPMGTGCCYNEKNQTSMLVTDEGGFIVLDEDNMEEWTWPTGNNAKLSIPINIQLNGYMSIKILSRSSITLTFQSGNHVVKLPLGLPEGPLPAPNTEAQFLKMDDQIPYTSQTAQEMMQRSKQYQASIADRQSSVFTTKRGKSRDVKTPKKDETTTNTVEFLHSSSHQQDISKVERDYNRLRNKARNLVDEWMETYRVALGMTSPQIKAMRTSFSWPRGLPSAKSLPPHAQSDNADELATTPIPEIVENDKIFRAPSAPSAFNSYSYLADDVLTELSAPRLSAREKSTTNTLRYTKSSSVSIKVPQPSGVEQVSRSYDATITQQSNIEWTVACHYQCPVALRNQLLGQTLSGPHICKCQRRRIPYMTDVELDAFVARIVPSKQLIVVSVISSMYPEKDRGGVMLDRLHAERNANRTHVCMQARNDPYRVFRYDVATAYLDTESTQPLLLSRHNAVPGMFLIFQGGNLVFCDHIFNGYGNAKKDFEKQLVACRKLAHRGFTLPKDFKFTPQTGKQGPRSPWGGQIGGAGVDKHGSPGTAVRMPHINSKATDRCSSPDSVSTLEYHIGKNMNPDDVYTAKTLVNKLSTKFRQIMISTSMDLA